MNIIQGIVQHKETGLGISKLIIAVLDLDPNTTPEEILTTTPAEDLKNSPERLGSVFTDSEGNFSLSYEDVEFQTQNPKEKRPDISIEVLAPEDASSEKEPIVLYKTVRPRQNAGRMEAFIIKIDSKKLESAGIAIPTINGSENIEEPDPLKIYENDLKDAKKFKTEKQRILQKEVIEDNKLHIEKRQKNFIAPFKEAISKLPLEFRNSAQFVKEGESVHIKALNNIKSRINQIFLPEHDKNPMVKGFIYLTEAQRKKYQDAGYLNEAGFFDLPDAVIEAEILPKIYGSTTNGNQNEFFTDHPVERLSRIMNETVAEKNTPTETGPTEVETTIDPATLEDIPKYIAGQMHSLKADSLSDISSRNSIAQLTENVNALRLKKGPADIPRFYDFHKLNIAFEHVWKEAADLGLIRNAEALYDQIVELGEEVEVMEDKVHLILSGAYMPPIIPNTDSSIHISNGIILEFPDAVNIWNNFIKEEKIVLKKLARLILGKFQDEDSEIHSDQYIDYFTKGTDIPYVDTVHITGSTEALSFFRQKGQKIIENVKERIEENIEARQDYNDQYNANKLYNALSSKLNSNYSFTYYAADKKERSVNFAILLTYRQKWDPLDSQVGEIAHSIPLPPKAVQKVSSKTVVKKSRSQKEIENNLQVIKSDTADTDRAESEIFNKAVNNTSFKNSTTANFNIPISEKVTIGGSSTLDVNHDTSKESNSTKKDFHESILKAAREYTNERKLEITTDESYERETTESVEISNPNDELTVTYLFFELQFQYRITETLHRLTPVILVAQEMPAPNEIDEDWILAHDWILKRVLLDDSFQTALHFIYSIAGEKLMLSEMTKSANEQKKIIKELKQNVKFLSVESSRLSRAMQLAINKEAGIVEGKDIWDGIPILGDNFDAVEGAIKGIGKLIGFGGGDDPTEAARIRREAATASYEKSDRERKELMARLEQETSILHSLTKQVAEKRKEVNEKDIVIVRLKGHLKDNILHYMHAIWSYENPDQRFFRLFNTKVPRFDGRYIIKINQKPSPNAVYDAVVEGKTRHEYNLNVTMNVEEITLAEVADVDNLLGFKGNYMMFPLKKSNILTNFMMAPYVDSEFGLLDPDDFGNWTLEEFKQYYLDLKKHMGAEFPTIEEELKEYFKKLLLDPLRQGDIVTIPTGSLYIEALPGTHSLLEDFKLYHRAMDVQKVQAEVRKMEMENIRYAARILNEEREDPDVEKRIIVEGNNNGILNPTE